MYKPETEIMHGMGEPGKSRSQKKRESSSWQQMGEVLAALGAAQIAALELSGDLDAAIKDLRSMKKHEARRRQMQLIGRHMRELSEDERKRIADFLANLDKRREVLADELHRLEDWREALLNEDTRAAALAEICAVCPEAEAKKLRHLTESAAAEREKGKGVKSFRELFRYLREL